MIKTQRSVKEITSQKPMRVLFCANQFWPSIGGREIFGSDLVKSLQERGHEMTVLTSDGDGNLPSSAKYRNIPIQRFSMFKAMLDRDVDQLVELRQQFVSFKRSFLPDLIHIHGFDAGLAFFHLETRDFFKAPLVITLTEDGDDLLLNSKLYRRVLCLADWINGVSASGLMQARQTVPEIVKRSSVIYNGVKVPRLAPATLPFCPATLLCLGRLQKQKGFDLALAAFASINQRFPNLRLVVAGDGPERSQLEHQVSKLHINDAVKFIGWVSPEEVPYIINTATLVLMPSRWEGLPIVGLQASMMARPVVAARVGGLPEVISDGHTGLLIPPEDHQALANAITILLERPSMSVRLGQAARQRVQEVFSWQRCVDAYAEVYRIIATNQSFNHVLGSACTIDRFSNG